MTITSIFDRDFNQISNATPRVTFWGCKVITFEDKTEVKLDTLSEQFSKKVQAKTNLTTEDRAKGIKTVNTLKTFYTICEDQAKDLNWFSHLLYKIRNAFRFALNDTHIHLCTFTLREYDKVFDSHYYCSIHTTDGSNPQIVAHEDHILRLQNGQKEDQPTYW